MKLIHLSDLHLGKRLNDFSLLEDQKYILTQILGIVECEAPDAIMIAGDVYDKAMPPAEAVTLFDDFLSRLADLCGHIFIISGNHDSAERLAFGGRLLSHRGVHLSPVYDGLISPVTVSDKWGETDFYMLPFIKPAHLRRYYPEEQIESYTGALSIALSGLPKEKRRSVLITHQFVTGALRSESEEISVGGSDNVDASVFEGFDYVALGHLHTAQSVCCNTIRYCGSPLKYSFSESKQEKSVTVVAFESADTPEIYTIPLTPLRDMRELRGSYEELTLKENYQHTVTSDYLRITLTDEENIPDAAAKLRVFYPNLMRLDYDNRRTRTSGVISISETDLEKSPLELFGELYEKQNGAPLSADQKTLSKTIIAEIWEAGK